MSLEHKLLSCLTDPANIARVWGMGLRAAVFEEPFNQFVYTFIIGYWLEGQREVAPTALVIETERPGFRIELVEEEPWWLAEQLIKRFATNGVQEMTRAAATTCPDDPVGTLKRLQADSYRATEAIAARHSRSDMRDYEGRRRRYQEKDAGVGTGLTLGLDGLDAHTGGVRPGELCVVGAYSKVGKTFFLLQAAVAARQAGHTPLVFTLEMAIEEIEDRIDALMSQVSYDRLSKHKLSVEELRHLRWCQETMVEMGPVIIESPEDDERTVEHLASRYRNSGADYLFIDQLSFMEAPEGRYPTEKMRLARILRPLKNEIGRASRGKIPCMLACQMNRESLDRPDGPLIKDFADAAEVERTADLLLALSGNREMERNQAMRLDVLGGRRCNRATWMLAWDLKDQTRIDHVRSDDGRPERWTRDG